MKQRWFVSLAFFSVLLYGLLLLLLPQCAFATTWIVLRGRDKNSQYAYDRDRLRVDGQYVSFWRRVRFREPQVSEFGEVSRAIYQERIDCQNQTLQTIFVGLYDAQRRPLLERSMPEPIGAVLILPESIGELFQNVVCRYATGPHSPSTLGSTHSGSKVDNASSVFVPKHRPVVIDSNALSPVAPAALPSSLVPIAPIPPSLPIPAFQFELGVPTAPKSTSVPTPPIPSSPIVPPLLPSRP